MLGIALKRVEGCAIRPLDQHHDLARGCAPWLRAGLGVEAAERDDLAAILADRGDAVLRVRQVVIVVGEIEQIQGVERHGRTYQRLRGKSRRKRAALGCADLVSLARARRAAPAAVARSGAPA